MSQKKKKSTTQKKIVKFKKRIKKYIKNNGAVILISLLFLIVLFAATFYLTTFIFKKTTEEPDTNQSTTEMIVTTLPETITTTLPHFEETTVAETTTAEEVTTEEQTTSSNGSSYTPGNIVYPSDTSSWELICVNRNRYVASDVEDKIKLSYVAGSGELMDSRAAVAYDEMYDAAAKDGIYLTPCSGYRSYSTQKRLYNEFYYQYINQGYSSEEAHNLTSKRRNPAGSSEHNLGICMDIICAASSANFQNTKAYAWLQENAHNYGFILRYPEDKVDVTGVKFEPWHWRYVGVENAASIRDSGLCLEEYLGLA